jgi:hypothetical protein
MKGGGRDICSLVGGMGAREKSEEVSDRYRGREREEGHRFVVRYLVLSKQAK